MGLRLRRGRRRWRFLSSSGRLVAKKGLASRREANITLSRDNSFQEKDGLIFVLSTVRGGNFVFRHRLYKKQKGVLSHF